MACGIPEAATALNDQIDSVKGEINGLIADANEGIASAVTGLKDKIKGTITDAMQSKLDEIAPELPAPQANLQDTMNQMMAAADDPKKFLESFNSIQDNFPGLDVNGILASAGIDADKMNSLAGKVTDLLNTDLSSPESILGAVGGFELPFSGGQSIEGALNDICQKVPNIEKDALGNIVKKGVPSTLPTVDAAIAAALPEKKTGAEPSPPKHNAPLNSSATVKTREKGQTKEQKLTFNQIVKDKNLRQRNELTPLRKELFALKEQIQAAKDAQQPVDAQLVAEKNAVLYTRITVDLDITAESRKKYWDNKVLSSMDTAPTPPKIPDAEVKEFTKGFPSYESQIRALQFIEIV